MYILCSICHLVIMNCIGDCKPAFCLGRGCREMPLFGCKGCTKVRKVVRLDIEMTYMVPSDHRFHPHRFHLQHRCHYQQWKRKTRKKVNSFVEVFGSMHLVQHPIFE